MSAAAALQSPAAGWQAGFLLSVLPAVRTHAGIQFRHLPPVHREEAVQEAVAAACVSYRRLAARGRLHAARPGMLADFAAKHVRSGRHVGGRQDAARDVMSPAARRRHGVRVVSYGCAPAGGGGSDGWSQRVVAGRRDSVPDVAAFRIDFADWLQTLSDRDRRVVDALAAGEGTSAVAERFGLSEARVSQLRRKYEHSWLAFQAE